MRIRDHFPIWEMVPLYEEETPMTNLLRETLVTLDMNHKSPEDVRWVGGNDFTIPWEQFLELSNTEYDAGYGAQHVAQDLIIAGDGWWLTRSEYDGSEGWEFHTMPQKPQSQVLVTRVVLDSEYEKKWQAVDFNQRCADPDYHVGWVDLAEMNAIDTTIPVLPAGKNDDYDPWEGSPPSLFRNYGWRADNEEVS